MSRWLPVAAYALFIFYLSHQPSLPTPSFFLSDRLFHFGSYLLLGLLVARAYGKNFVVIALLAATLYGLSDELHQYFIPGRSAEALDLLADAIGGSCGGLLFRWLRLWPQFSRITE